MNKGRISMANSDSTLAIISWQDTSWITWERVAGTFNIWSSHKVLLNEMGVYRDTILGQPQFRTIVSYTIIYRYTHTDTCVRKPVYA